MTRLGDLFAATTRRPLVIGHRGAKAHAPENTLASFRRGIKDGADAIELDVHLSHDGVPVVIHDESLERTTNGAGEVRAHTLAQLKRLDAGGWFGSAFKGERIPTLAEAVEAITPHVPTVVELKNIDDAYPGLEKAVLDVLRAQRCLDRCLVISFDPGTVERVRRADPSVATGQLGVDPKPSEMEELGAFGDAFLFLHSSTTPAHVAEAARLGKPLFVWTVNDAGRVRHYARMGIAGVASDDPAMAVRALKALP